MNELLVLYILAILILSTFSVSSSFAALPVRVIPYSTYIQFDFQNNMNVSGIIFSCSEEYAISSNKLPIEFKNLDIHVDSCDHWIPDSRFGISHSNGSILKFSYPHFSTLYYSKTEKLILVIYMDNTTYMSSPIYFNENYAYEYSAKLFNHTIFLKRINSKKMNIEYHLNHHTPFTTCDKTDVLIHSSILSSTGFIFIFGISYMLFGSEIKNKRKNLSLSLINSFVYSSLQFLILYLLIPCGTGCISYSYILLYILPYESIPIVIAPLISFAILQKYFTKKISLLVHLFVAAFTSFLASIAFLFLVFVSLSLF